jgi:long-chain acyl-CoA synthetase
MVFVFENAEIGFAIVEDQEQVDKMLEVRDRCPALGCIVYDDPRGLRNYESPALFLRMLLETGARTLLKSHPGFVQAEMRRGDRPTMPPRCSTPRAPPVRPRASCTPIAT